MRNLFVFCMVIGLVISCQSSSKLKPIDYRETPTPTDTGMCSQAETHLTSMCKANMEENFYCCQVITLTKKGKNFTQFCEETQAAGIALNPQCISTITSCEQIDKCVGSVR